MNRVKTKIPFDKMMDFSIIKKLGSVPKYANQRNEYNVTFAPKTVSAIKAESGEILTKTIKVHFFPNSFDLFKKIARKKGNKTVEELYDPNVPKVLEEIGKLAGQYGAARIVIEGHSDSSMKNHGVPFSAVEELSRNRAQAVKAALLKQFKSLQPNQFATQGMGWKVPADSADPMNHAKNRRVEVKVFPLESQ